MSSLLLTAVVCAIVASINSARFYKLIETYNNYTYNIDRKAASACLACSDDTSDTFGPCTAVLLYARRLSEYNDALYTYRVMQESQFTNWFYHKNISKYEFKRLELKVEK